MTAATREGVVRFTAEHEQAEIAAAEIRAVRDQLLGWRAVLHRLGLVGQDPSRYNGAGFGNLSARLPPLDAGLGQRAFVITGTQTGAKPVLGDDDLCLVRDYDFSRNSVRSRGLVLPSSESMTHGAVYDVLAAARFVFHVHAPVLWRACASLGLPVTRADVEYGTPAMALEVQRLLAASAAEGAAVLAMGGHEDGIVAFGASAREAGAALLDALALAYARPAARAVVDRRRPEPGGR